MGPKTNHCGTCQCIRHSILQWRSSLGTLHPELAYWDALHKTLLLMQDALRPWKRRMGAAMRKNNNREAQHDHLHAAGLCTSDLACNYVHVHRKKVMWLVVSCVLHNLLTFLELTLHTHKYKYIHVLCCGLHWINPESLCTFVKLFHWCLMYVYIT